MKKIILLLLVSAFAYFLLWPVSIDPVAWQPSKTLGYQGDFVMNKRLLGMEQLSINGEDGPEDIDQDSEGNLYTSVHSGWIMRKNTDADAFIPWVNTEGRPLGMDFDASGNLIVADAYRGLLQISEDKKVSVLTDKVGDSPILYADDVDIAPDGKIYFSDASTRFGAESNGGTYAASLLDVMEHSRSGRVLVFDPVTKTTQIVIDGLSFANGVAMDPNGRFILVNETSEYRIHKVWLQGEKVGQSEVLIDQLPGFPDNIVPGKNGRFWFGLVSPRLPVVDALADQPFVRKIVQRLPAWIRPAALHYSHVVAIDASGKVLLSLQDPAGTYPVTTGALEADDGYLYISSLMATYVGRLKLPAELQAP